MFDPTKLPVQCDLVTKYLIYSIAGRLDGGLNFTVDDAHVKLNPINVNIDSLLSLSL